MAAFKVNGKNVCSEKNQKLLRFLRDELRLTSVKDGCSEGACGACTVIIDGKTCKACVPDTDSLSGREIITVEGLTEWERQVYTYAYGKAGAVQCGFCIPGMVMCTKALLDENMEPTDDEIRYALRNNYCRCTGYVKIMDAVRLAAKILKKGEIPDDGDPNWTIGNRVARIDVAERIGNPSALTQEQGDIIFHEIDTSFKHKEEIFLDFSNVESMISPFLNNAIGQLYENYTTEDIKHYLHLENFPPTKNSTLNIVINNAKKFYANKKTFAKTAKDVLNVE